MTWWDTLDAAEWRTWLLTLTAKHHVPAGQRLDPFGTSMRSLSRQVLPWLRAMRASDPIEGEPHRQTQALTDMGSIGLVAQGEITPFGYAFLERTDHLAESFEFELPITFALLLEAIEAEQKNLLEMLGFWWDIRQLYTNDALLRNRDGLLLVSYLNQSVGTSDYNPWIDLRGSGTRIAVPIDWPGLKKSVQNRNATTDKAVSKLKDRVGDNRRYAPRVVFCTAMDLVFERHESIEAATTHLEAMKLPVRHDR